MQEIIELKIEETKSVVGGVMANVPAVTSAPRERPVTSSLSPSWLRPLSRPDPTCAQSDSVALIALRTLGIHYPHSAGDQRAAPEMERPT
jgi:hypothetical protein